MAGECTSYTGFSHPTPSYLILPHPTRDSTPFPSYLAYLILTDRVGWGRVGCLSAMARDTSHFYPTPSNHFLLRPTLETYTKNTRTELASCVRFFCTSSGWFMHSEPPRTTPTCTHALYQEEYNKGSRASSIRRQYSVLYLSQLNNVQN